VCGDPAYSTLCEAVLLVGLDAPLNEGLWTVFAPTNSAFEASFNDLAAAVNGNFDVLTDSLLFHVVPDIVLLRDDLPCELTMNTIRMANEENTQTICEDDVSINLISR
jgi:uncharacterized surface protein with fasciclin (FAS1) repeats